jgi:hypothetical protein
VRNFESFHSPESLFQSRLESIRYSVSQENYSPLHANLCLQIIIATAKVKVSAGDNQTQRGFFIHLHMAYGSQASINSSGGLAVKRITSNDEIPGLSPGRSSFFLFFLCSERLGTRYPRCMGWAWVRQIMRRLRYG